MSRGKTVLLLVGCGFYLVGTGSAVSPELYGATSTMGPHIEPNGTTVAMGPEIEPHGFMLAMGPEIEPHGIMAS